MSPSYLEVVRVVTGGNLDKARAEIPVDVGIGYQGNDAVCQGRRSMVPAREMYRSSSG
ncbi:hypothetical protein MASR2M48_34900 [Spirochaetota bacterium]